MITSTGTIIDIINDLSHVTMGVWSNGHYTVTRLSTEDVYALAAELLRVEAERQVAGETAARLSSLT